MRSIPLMPALLVVALAPPVLAATGEREARSPPHPAQQSAQSAGAGPGAGGASAGNVAQDQEQGSAASQGRGQDRSQRQGPEPSQSPGSQEQDARQYAPDNTGRNRQHDTQLEADDQSNDPADVQLVSTIRRALTDDASLSLQGHNVKIIVQGGRVTLRGPVKGEAEKRKVEAIARKAAGKRQVVNELEATGR